MLRKKPLVSVVIPAYNEEKYIYKCLQTLSNQDYKPIEIIVVDDGSSDSTIEIIKSFKKVKLILGEHKGPGFSRNLGAKVAKGEILIFIDADMSFPNNYVFNLIKRMLNDNNVIGTTHDYEVATNIDNIWSYLWGEIRVKAPPNSGGKQIKGWHIFRAIRKDKFFEYGGFDPKYGYADDQTFWFKYKLLPTIAENTTCYHRNAESLKEVYRQSRWIGASIDNLFLRMPLIKYITPLLLYLFSPILILILSFYRAHRKHNWKIFFRYIIPFISMRYFGNVKGILNKTYLSKNIK